MKSVIKKITMALSALLVTSGLTLAVATVPAHAQEVSCDSGVGRGVALTNPEAGDTTCTDDGETSFASIVRNIINIFSIVVGAVSVIMIIVGGFRYIISNGDSNGVSGAKNTILYAIIGLVIVLFAQVIVRFVLTQVSQ